MKWREKEKEEKKIYAKPVG